MPGTEHPRLRLTRYLREPCMGGLASRPPRRPRTLRPVTTRHLDHSRKARGAGTPHSRGEARHGSATVRRSCAHMAAGTPGRHPGATPAPGTAQGQNSPPREEPVSRQKASMRGPCAAVTEPGGRDGYVRLQGAPVAVRVLRGCRHARCGADPRRTALSSRPPGRSRGPQTLLRWTSRPTYTEAGSGAAGGRNWCRAMATSVRTAMAPTSTFAAARRR